MMRTINLALMASSLVVTSHLLSSSGSLMASDKLNSKVETYVTARVAEFGEIPAERQAALQEVADYVTKRLADGGTARLTFVCTHNSRRSHFSQLWAKAAAVHYGIEPVETFSGGTEATAFNPRSIAALQRAGFECSTASATEKNPRYSVQFSATAAPTECFSKVYDAPPNPTSEFCAVMTCSEADKSCPTVRGCDKRLAIPYMDPKVSDNTPQETATYDERCAQIAREMLFLMSRVKRP